MKTLLVLITLTGLAVAGTNSPPTADDLEKASLDARTRIRTAVVTFTLKSRFKGPEGMLEYFSERKTWMDGTKIRAEYRHRKGPDEGVRYLECVNCEKEGWGFHSCDAKGRSTDFYSLGSPGKPDLRDAIDPRRIGYIPTSYVTLGRFPINGMIGSPNRSIRSVKKELFADTESWVIRWDKPKATGSVWIAPSKGNSVLRIEVEDQLDGKPFTQSMTSDVALAGESGLWYPTKVAYRQHWGESVLAEDTIEVQEVRLNEPIPPETFTLAGAQLQSEPYVTVLGAGKSGFLRDGKIDTSQPSDTRFDDISPPTPVDPPGMRINYWLVAVCLVCAAAAIALVVFRRRTVA